MEKSGDEVVSYTYDTWGRLLSIDGKLKDSLGVKNPYRYRGYRYDNETEFYYLQSRYYNPEWGRFLNADSLVGEIGGLLSHNMFAYCSNDPVNNEDPDGDIAWWVGAAFGAAEYLLTHRRGGATWKGLGKAAAGGAISGVLFGGAGRVLKGARALNSARKVKKVGNVSKGYKSKVKMNVQLLAKNKTNNMSTFFKTEFGTSVKNGLSKTTQQFQGQSVYKVANKLDNPYLKKGDRLYLDNLHKYHFEVFDKKGKLKAVLNLDGSLNTSKTKKAYGRILK